MILVFDSSSLISVSQTCLIGILHGLKREMHADFVIPASVFAETVSRPLQIKRFELNAVRLQKAVQQNWLRVEKSIDHKRAEEILAMANNCFFTKGRPIALLQRGEVDALALIGQLDASSLVIDERTTRMLIEAPEKLRYVMQRRYKGKVSVDRKKAKMFSSMFRGLNIVRSVELIALAFELGLLGKELVQGRQTLHAALFAAKYSGCSVTEREIERFLGKG